jgi:hypothetical protein
MALFRFHRGSLDDSLNTTVVVATQRDLETVIALWHADFATEPFQVNLQIEPYPSESACFDKRIGWYTHMVTADLEKPGKFLVVGFLSESFE